MGIDEARHDGGSGDVELDGTGGDVITDGDDAPGGDLQAGGAADAVDVDDARPTQDQISRLWRAPGGKGRAADCLTAAKYGPGW